MKPTPQDVHQGDPHDCGTLLGLYHGYDQACRVLERLSRHYRQRASQEEQVVRELARRACDDEPRHRDAYERVAADVAALEGLNRGAHTAVLSAFALISDKAEELRRQLLTRCPELGDELGAPEPRAPGPSPGH